MNDKQKIELMVPKALLDEYLSRINITERFVAREFHNESSKDWRIVDALLIEGVKYAMIERLIKEIPREVEVFIIDDPSEQYYHKANLIREGANFLSRNDFLSKFDQESNEEESKEVVDLKVKRERKSIGAFLSGLRKKSVREKIDSKEEEKPRLSTILPKAKSSVQKIEIRSTQKETLIPIIKVTDSSKKKVKGVEGTYMLCGSAFNAFLLADYLSRETPVSLVDLTGDLNNFYGCNEHNKLQELTSGKDDPLVIYGKIFLYVDDKITLNLEDLLMIKEVLLQESSILLIYTDTESMNKYLAGVEKGFYYIKEEDVIKGLDCAELVKSVKSKIVINKRINILSRSAIREALSLDESTELMETPSLDTSEVKEVYKAILKKEPVKKDIIDKYFSKFLEQF